MVVKVGSALKDGITDLRRWHMWPDATKHSV